MTVPSALKDGPSGRIGRAPVRFLARPGIAVATSAPVALIVWSTVPSYRPVDLIPCLLSVIAAAGLVMAAQVASSGQDNGLAQVNAPPTSSTAPVPQRVRPRRSRPPTGVGRPDRASQPFDARPGTRSDPAMVSVERWLSRWPGVAGVSAVFWWAARIGVAGLLSSLALSAVGAPSPALLGAWLVIVVAMTALLPGSRHLVHVGLGLVALTGVVVTGSGIVALVRGELSVPLLPSGPLWPAFGSTGGVVQGSATTVVLICLAAVCLPGLGRATLRGARKPTKWVIWVTVSAAVACWAFAVPALLRVAGLSLPAIVSDGRTGALRSTLATVLRPVAGANAGTLAGWVLCAACVSGAIGAMAGATGLAEMTIGAARSTQAGRQWPVRAMPGVAHRRTGNARADEKPTGNATPNNTVPMVPLTVVPLTGSAAIAAASGLAAAGVAVLGPLGWLVIGLGGLATGALALTTLAPPLLHQNHRAPALVRAAVAGTWAVVVVAALGSAGPAALAMDGVAALAGAFAVGRSGRTTSGNWRTSHLALPASTAAAALVTISAVATLELVPMGGVPGSSATWRWLAVVVVGAGTVVLAAFPATSRLWAEQLRHAANTLAEKTLPALATALEAIASGEAMTSGDALAGSDANQLRTTGLSELVTATRPSELELAAYRAPDDMLQLRKALIESFKQAQRLAAGVEAVARGDRRHLEQLVEERTAGLSHANRHLVNSHVRRRQLLDRTVRVAEGERARIAANLHDGPIQRLAALGLILDRCQLRLDRDDKTGAQELVTRARNELTAEIQSLRQMMSELRPPILDEGGLEAAIRDHLSSWSAATGIETRFEVADYSVLSANDETVIYRVVQEALANVAKHASASHTLITLTQSGSGVRVGVRDNGRGFNARSQPDLLRSGHFGLVVMRERVELAAGRFEIQSAPLNGTEVIIWLPSSSTGEPGEPVLTGATTSEKLTS